MLPFVSSDKDTKAFSELLNPGLVDFHMKWLVRFQVNDVVAVTIIFTRAKNL